MIYLTQIYLSDEKSVPEYFLHNQSHIKKLYSNCKYQLYDFDLIREFITDKMGGEVISAFNKLKPYAYKADLARLCVLYELGGWYFDISLRPLLYLEIPPEIEFFTFRDMQNLTGTSFSCTNGIIYTTKNNPIVLKAIELILENCATNYFGMNSLCPTGPNSFGRAISFFGPNSRNAFGDVVFLTPAYQNKNKAFVLPSGEIFCYFKVSDAGDLKYFGAKGVNNYNDLYKNHDIYWET